MSITPEQRQKAIDLAEWHFASTMPGGPQIDRPAEIQETMDRLRAQLPIGEVALGVDKPAIPEEVRKELDEYKAKYRAPGKPNDNGITEEYLRSRGYPES